MQAHIHAPSLAYGATGPGVVALEQRLRELHYALRDTSGVFDDDDQGAVLAFQKVNGLERTGVVTPALWSLLAARGRAEGALRRRPRRGRQDAAGALPRPRRQGRADDARLDRRDGQHAARRVARLQQGRRLVWVLWYPSYFLRGFAIHGYPEVPAYPASHGCVRIPMWLAPKLFEQIPMGSAIYIYT